jgi:poly(hydroxyalkanoate) depolymerase family esterase
VELPLFTLGDWVKAAFDLGSGGGIDHPAAGGMSGRPAMDPGTGSLVEAVGVTPHGQRDYLLFIPARPAPRPMVILMLHGCGQSAADFMAASRMNDLAAAHGAHVIWPQQDRRDNGMRCWNWHDPQHQGSDGGEPALLVELLDQVLQDHGLADADVYVAGLSAGGSMAAVLAGAFPSRFQAIGVHSGLPPGAAASLSEAMRAMRDGAAPGVDSGVPLILFHGDLDDVVSPVNGDALAHHIDGSPEPGAHEGRHEWTRRQGPSGEYWLIHGLGHAWSGGAAGLDHSDPAGPDASSEMMRFFLQHRS